jgi:hypothetical protein
MGHRVTVRFEMALEKQTHGLSTIFSAARTPPDCDNPASETSLNLVLCSPLLFGMASVVV